MIPLKTTDPGLVISHKKTEKERQAEVVDYLINHKRKTFKQFKANVLLFFSIGLTISLLLINVLFQWKSYDSQRFVDIAAADVTTEELIDIPVTKQPPPPPQQMVQQPNIIEVTEEEIIEDIQVDFDIEITEDQAIDYTEVSVQMEEPEEEVAEEIFTIVEDAPTPVGGLTAFYTYINENIKYPVYAMRMGIEGKVFVQFVVNSDGTLTDLNVVKGVGGGCDEEAIRVLKNAPAWNPGKQRGQPVRVRMIIPITFVLGGR